MKVHYIFYKKISSTENTISWIFFFISFLSSVESVTNFLEDFLSIIFLYRMENKILSIQCVIYKSIVVPAYNASIF